MSPQSVAKYVGEKIRSLRKSRDMTQLDLAEALHVNSQMISNWETTKKRLDLDDLHLISSFFELEIQDLLPPKSVNEQAKSS